MNNTNKVDIYHMLRHLIDKNAVMSASRSMVDENNFVYTFIIKPTGKNRNPHKYKIPVNKFSTEIEVYDSLCKIVTDKNKRKNNRIKNFKRVMAATSVAAILIASGKYITNTNSRALEIGSQATTIVNILRNQNPGMPVDMSINQAIYQEIEENGYDATYEKYVGIKEEKSSSSIKH